MFFLEADDDNADLILSLPFDEEGNDDTSSRGRNNVVSNNTVVDNRTFSRRTDSDSEGANEEAEEEIEARRSLAARLSQTMALAASRE